jgi:hypothetical protein
MVPTTISDSAVAIRNHLDTRVAIRAQPNHIAASAQISVMFVCRQVSAATEGESCRSGLITPKSAGMCA